MARVKKTLTVKTTSADRSGSDRSMTARQFVGQLEEQVSSKELSKLEKFFKGEDGETKALGVRFGTVFKLAADFRGMPLREVNKLLDSSYYEVRMGAVSIMDFQARAKTTTATRRKELFDLYLKRHDRLNNWDFVDRAAPSVIGAYLKNKPRDVLYKLARSNEVWKRRTAIVSTYAFIREGEVEDTFRLAELLVHDKHELIHKAVGSWIRTAGLKNKVMLLNFLDKHGTTMPRVTLRYAVEKLDAKSKAYFMNRT